MGSEEFRASEQPRLDGTDLLCSLTPSQREAVQHIEGPQLILAGPGSGKTRVVTHRVAYMLEQGIPEQSIIALTFTNKAADEMRQRLERLCPGRRVWMGTFHRFCAQQLRKYAALVGLKENFSIYDSDDSLKILREAIADSDVELIDETPGQIASAISWAKNRLMSAEQYVPAPGNPVGALAARIYPHYQSRLMQANAVDFDDLLLHFACLLQNNEALRGKLDQRYRYVMVDEYQDTNLAQYAIVRTLSVDYPNLSVTGDPDQSIYGWRGATIRNILEFESDFRQVQVVRLEDNFRSTKSILRAADQLIANNRQRKAKTLRTSNSEGQSVRLTIYPTARQEADVIAARIANEVAAGARRYHDYAIFYRTNALSRVLESSFRAVSIPYQIVRGLEFYQRKEIKDILAYLHLLNNPANDIAFLRIVNTPPRRIGKKTVQCLAGHARTCGLPLLEAARKAGLIPSLGKRAAVEVAKFVALIDAMSLLGNETVEDALTKVLRLTHYRHWLETSGKEEDLQRIDNLDELQSDAREFDESHPDEAGLEAFLEQASLVADVDDWEGTRDCVTMMTLHAAKGLEFPVVFVVALEQDTLPHVRSQENPEQLEEERRLLFVGITRAQEELHLSAAQERFIRGKIEYVATSEFLMELPREEMEIIGRLGYSEFGAGEHFNDIESSGDAQEDWDTADGSWQDEDSPDLVYSSDWEYDEDLQRQLRAKKKKKVNTKRPQRPLRDDCPTNPPVDMAPFVTAAELAGSDPSQAPLSPAQFRQGMVVIHPEYGIGTIVTIGGSGKKRSAAVQFAGDAGRRSFQLAFSPLRPVGS